MGITMVATLMIMVAYFLVLYGGVAFIQDKRFFSSAPKETFLMHRIWISVSDGI